MERKNQSSKSNKDYNFPAQQQNKLINFIDKFEMPNKIISFKNNQNIPIQQIHQSQKQNLKNENVTILCQDLNTNHHNQNSDRSNSIQGRKLSFCDAKLTVSKNTIENQEQEQVNYTYREMETLQRLSAVGLNMGNNQHNISHPVLKNNKSIDQFLTAKILKNNDKPLKRKSPLKENRAFQLNQQVKDAYQNLNKKKTLSKSNQKSKDKNINRKQPEQSFLLTFSKEKSQSPRSQNKQGYKDNLQLKKQINLKYKITNKENDKNANDQLNYQKQSHNKSVFVLQSQNFIEIIPQRILKAQNIKENRIKKLEDEGEKIKQSFMKQNSSAKKPQRPKTQIENNKYISSSPSYNSSPNKYPKYNNNNQLNNVYDDQKRQQFQSRFSNKNQAFSDEKQKRNSNSRSIDKIVKENIKKFSIQQKKVLEKQLLSQIQKSLKQQQIKLKNKQIRDRNQHNISIIKQRPQPQGLIEIKSQIGNHNKSMIEIQNNNNKQSKQVNQTVDQSLQMRSKSPLKQFNQAKNRDMPLKIIKQENELQQQNLKKKKYDLGLDIFELKKEMGLYGSDKQGVSIEQILTERQKQKKQKKQQKENVKEQMQIQQEMAIKNKYQENPQLQKLILQQHKKRNKQLKIQKIMEFMNQQKVLMNLQQLNQVTEAQRQKKKLKIKSSKTNQFRTVQDIDNSNQQYSNLSNIRSIKQFNKDNRQSIQDQQHINYSQLQHKSQSRIDNKSPVPKIKKKLNIKQQSKIYDQKIPKSSRVSLLEPQNKILVKIPKAKVLYSYISQQQNSSQNDYNARKSSEKKNKHRQSKSPILDHNKKSGKKQKLIQKLMKQLQLQQQIQDSYRQQQQQKQTNKSRSKSFNRKKSSKNNISQQDHRIISIDTPGRQNNLQQQILPSFNLIRQNQQNVLNTQREEQNVNSYFESPQKINQTQFQNQQIMNVQLQHQQQQQDPNMSVQSDNVMVDDEMMIFCVLTTAASIIQRQFRKYLNNKRKITIDQEIKLQYEQDNSNQNRNSLSKNEYQEQSEEQKLSESTKLENRFLPVNKQYNEENKQREKLRKTPKHTFSFGNYDESQISLQQNQSQFQNLTKRSQQQLQQQEEDSVVYQSDQNKFSSNNNKNKLENNSFRLDSSPNQDYQPIFSDRKHNINNASQNTKQLSHQQQSQNVNQNVNESYLPNHDFSLNNQEDKEENNILIIDDKFKYALRNLAEKQKQTNIYDIIKNQKSKQNISVLNQQNQSNTTHVQSQNIMQSVQKQDYRSDLERELEELYEKSKEKSLQRERQAHLHYINEEIPTRFSQRMNESNQKYQYNDNNEVMRSLQQQINMINVGNDDNGQESNHVELSKVSIQLDDDSDQEIKDMIKSRKDLKEQLSTPDEEDNQYLFESTEKKVNQNQSLISSLMGSKGQQTDKIIRFSPINTNEQLIEAAVNETNTLIHEDSSILNVNDSNVQSKITSSQKQSSGTNGQKQIDISKEEIKIDYFANQPIFEYKFQKNNDKKQHILSPMIENVDSDIDSKPYNSHRHQFNQQSFDQLLNYEQNNQQNFNSANIVEGRKSDSNKPLLRLVFGDEKFLLDHDYELQGKLSIGGTPRDFQMIGSAPSTHRLLMTENPYFLATNGSIFERNPFHEFTTNKLNEILANKNYNEINQLKDDALKYQEKLEIGYINRMEKREEISPKSLQRRKYELESWVTLERNKNKQNKEETLSNKPINLADLEQERREAAQIIENVNKKVKEIKQQINYKTEKPQENLIHIQDQQQQQPNNKQTDNSDIDSKSGISSSKLDISMEAQKQSKDQETNKIIIPNISNTYLNEISNNSLNGKEKEEMPTVVLEISFEEDDDDEFEEFKFLKEKNQQDTLELEKFDATPKQTDIQQEQVKQSSTQQNNDNKDKQIVSKNKISEEQVTQITNLIFEEFITQEKNGIIKQMIDTVELRKSQNQINERNKIEQEQQNNQQQHREDKSQAIERYANDDFSQILVKPKPQLEATLRELTYNSREQIKRLGIDTTLESIEQYVDEIFNQITVRREQFLQAFITPIYKNPLEILQNLQRPDYGEIDTQMDFTNSLAYILNVQLYLTLEKARENLIHETIQQIKRQYLLQSASQLQSLSNEDELTDMISEAQHIHNKVVFDCVNEALNQVRPYGNQGEPMPWSKKPRRNLMFMFDSTENLDQILIDIKSKVIGWAKTKAGALPPKYNTLELNYQSQMEEEHFAHQREKCLAQLLAQDLIVQEEKWLDYEMEEAQVKIDLSDIILEHLVGETVDIINQIKGDPSKINTIPSDNIDIKDRAQ